MVHEKLLLKVGQKFTFFKIAFYGKKKAHNWIQNEKVSTNLCLVYKSDLSRSFCDLI